MKALIVKHNLNACGGAEYFTLCVIRVLRELGYKVDLLTDTSPDLLKIKRLFDTDISVNRIITLSSSIRYIKGLPKSTYSDRVIQIMLGYEAAKLVESYDYDLVFFTHCDTPHTALLYSNLSRGKKLCAPPTLCYIHYPHVCTTRALVRKNIMNTFTYIPLLIADSVLARTGVAFRKCNMYVLCNSKFTANAILRVYGLHSSVLYPPARVEKLLELEVSERDKKPYEVITVTRIAPEKQVENAILLAKILPARYKVVVCGSLDKGDVRCRAYLDKLTELIRKLGLNERVQLIVDIPGEELVMFLTRASIYFHPTIGEHFGLAPVEALAAGTVPFVPSKSGCSEVIPKGFHWLSLTEAAHKIITFKGYKQSFILRLRRIAQYFTYEAFKNRLIAYHNTVVRKVLWRVL